MHAPVQPSTEPRPIAAAPGFLPSADVAACATYRDAVRLAWEHRARPQMTQATLAEICGLYAPHVSSYLHADPLDKQGKRRLDLPASCIGAFERAVGNHAVSQYLARVAALTLMEEVISQRHA